MVSVSIARHPGSATHIDWQRDRVMTLSCLTQGYRLAEALAQHPVPTASQDSPSVGADVGDGDVGDEVGANVGAGGGGGGPDAVQCDRPSDVKGAASSPAAHAHHTSAAGGLPWRVHTDGFPLMSITDNGSNVEGSLLRVICDDHTPADTPAIALFERLTSRSDVNPSKSPCCNDEIWFPLRSLKIEVVCVKVVRWRLREINRSQTQKT